MGVIAERRGQMRCDMTDQVVSGVTPARELQSNSQ